MLRQSLLCVAVENEQRCITGVINSQQQPVFTVLLRSIDNSLARLAYFHNFLAHLSRRLTGELIVYPCSGVRPSLSVHPSYSR